MSGVEQQIPKSVPVSLSKIYVNGNTIQLEYVCNICYENPRLKRKFKSHLHGGGSYDSFFRKNIDWDKPYSFGTRVPHCCNNNIEYQRDGCVSSMSDLIRNLPEVQLMYDPAITHVQEHLIECL